MSRELLCVALFVLIVVTHAAPVAPSLPHASVERAVVRRRHAHHVAFVIRAAQLAVPGHEEGDGLESAAAAEGANHTDVGKGDAAVAENETAQNEGQHTLPTGSETKESDTKPSEAKQSDTQAGATQQGKPQQGKPQQSVPEQSETQQNETQQNETQQNETQQNETQQNEPQQSEPQQSTTQQSEPQQNDTISDPRTQSDENAQLEQPLQAQQAQDGANFSKKSMQPPFNPSVSTVGFVGAIATVIVAAFLVWSKSSNSSLSPVQLASHAYQRVRSGAQDHNVSAQSSADADGWNAGWDDDDDWNPEAPSAKV